MNNIKRLSGIYKINYRNRGFGDNYTPETNEIFYMFKYLYEDREYCWYIPENHRVGDTVSHSSLSKTTIPQLTIISGPHHLASFSSYFTDYITNTKFEIGANIIRSLFSEILTDVHA